MDILRRVLGAGLVIVAGFAFSSSAWAQGDPDENYYQQQPVIPAEDLPPEPEAPAYDGPASYGYVGQHPVPYEYGQGFCTIEGAHSHDYPPFDQYLFREYDGYYYFTGDPADFGWTNNVNWFNGNHPVPQDWGGQYCYMTWPHRHIYAPMGLAGFSLLGAYWIYGGAFASDYYLWRDFYAGYYGGYYRNSYAGNRYYTVRPPPVYRAPSSVRIAAPPGRSFLPDRRPVTILAPPPGPAGAGRFIGHPPGSAYSPPPARGGGAGSGPPAIYGHPGQPGFAPAAGYGAQGYPPGARHAPQHYQPLPQNGYQAPMYRGPSPQPGFQQPSYVPGPAPMYRAAPGFNAPSPGFRTAPSFNAPSPGFRSPPSFNAPSPGFRTAPSFSAPSPGFRSAAPSFSSPAPAFRAAPPAFHSPAPSFRGSFFRR